MKTLESRYVENSEGCRSLVSNESGTFYVGWGINFLTEQEIWDHPYAVYEFDSEVKARAFLDSFDD